MGRGGGAFPREEPPASVPRRILQSFWKPRSTTRPDDHEQRRRPRRGGLDAAPRFRQSQGPAKATPPGEDNEPKARSASFWFTQKSVYDGNESQNGSDAGREETVIAEGMKHESLEIQKPQR